MAIQFNNKLTFVFEVSQGAELHPPKECEPHRDSEADSEGDKHLLQLRGAGFASARLPVHLRTLSRLRRRRHLRRARTHRFYG
jgi:hypothetical protein